VRKQWILCVALFAIWCAAFAGSGRSGGDATTPPFGYPAREARECATLCPGDRWPVSSPSGRRIEFMRRNRGRLDLMVMTADGSRQRPLAAGFGSPQRGLWSPDDRVLLLTCVSGRSTFGFPYARLCTVDVGARATPEPHVLIEPPDPYLSDFALDWSPDGQRIAFLRDRENWTGAQLLTARPDGSDLVSIGGGPGSSESYSDAAWSHDGRNLAFVTGTRLWVGDANGESPRVIAQFAEGVTIVDWSPDSRRIYVRMHPPLPSADPIASVAVVDVLGGGVETLVKRSHYALGQVSLSPDGTMLAFVQGRLIMIANTNESNVRVVAQGISTQVRARWVPGYGSLATTFTWSADSKRLVYVSDGQCPTLLGLYSIDLKSRRTRRLTQVCRIAGTARVDSLVGTDGTDGIYGFRGDDRIRAGGRPDYLEGGPGDDLLDGGRSDDRLYGGPGHDRLYGGLGFDAIVANDGSKDRVRCGSGYDIVWADRGDAVARDCELVIRK
jgi:Tol biopolymer transport system component